jgi:2'-5' RNA ligase
MFRRLNTIFIPDENFQKQVLALAAKIFKDKEEIFHIDNKSYFVHLTIYSPEYPLTNIREVISRVNEIAKGIEKFKLLFGDFSRVDGYVGINFRKTEEVTGIHKKILRKLNPLREGRIREKYPDLIKKGVYPPEQVKLINEYGYDKVLDFYEPHLTLGRFVNDEDATRALRELKNSVKLDKVLITKIGVSEMGPNGTCIKIGKAFNLK